MAFEKARAARLCVGVPQPDQKGVRNGWPKYYWKPWQKRLGGRKEKIAVRF
jgi:hypothetical protein